jgi:acetate kinase
MSRSVLVVNCGSSSIKYQLIDADSEQSLAKGLVERIGADDAVLRHTGPQGVVETEQPLADHDAGLRAVLAAFDEAGPNLADAGLTAVGHRVVHGGDRFADPAVVDDSVLDAIRDLIPLAPLHNPANLEGIEVAMRVFPDVPQVAVFDTAFHQTLPRHAYTYAIDREVAAELGIRRYGFHGTSHSYVSRTAARLLGKDPSELNMVVLHLGNGASASAVQHGRCIDTSMGLTPLEGLVMGTRSGDIDPAVVFHLRRVGEMSMEQIDTLLNKSSGLLGLCGANDLREVWAMADAGDADARNALDTYAYRIRKYIGAYALALGALDAVVFTAGVGENDVRMREQVLDGLERLNIVLDLERNADPKALGPVISTPESNVSVLVVPTNEELEIAQESLRVLALPTPA